MKRFNSIALTCLMITLITSGYSVRAAADLRDFSAGRVLAFELEPGIYEISKWKVITSGGMDFADFDAEGRSPIAFEVKSGEVSYLCNCHITVDMGENIFGDAVEDGAEAAIYDKIQRDMQYVDEKYPSLGELKVNNIAANLRVTEHALAP